MRLSRFMTSSVQHCLASIPDSGSPLKLFNTYEGMVGSYNSLSS